MRWEKMKLANCCISIADGDHQPPPKSETGIPFVTIANIQNNQFDFTNSMFVPVSYYEKLDEKRKAHKDDVLYSVVGSFGIPVLIKTELPFVFQRHIAILRPSKKIDSRFLYYTMLSRDFYMKADAAAIGAAQRTISLTALRNIEINVPPIEIQRRIADILSAYDDLIENNRKQIKLLEEAAQRLYKEWFVDLRFPGREHTRIVDGVPEGWEKTTVFDVSSVLRRGISPQYNDQGRSVVINQKCIRQSIVDFSEARYQEKPFPEELNIQDSDTVICSTGAGTLGRVGQIFGKYPQTTCDSHVTLVRAKANFGKQYLFHSLKSRQSYLMGMGKGSTNQLELSRSVIQDLDILVPTIEIRNNFEELTQLIHDQIKTISAEIERLQDNRDRLLPKLMSGEVEL